MDDAVALAGVFVAHEHEGDLATIDHARRPPKSHYGLTFRGPISNTLVRIPYCRRRLPMPMPTPVLPQEVTEDGTPSGIEREHTSSDVIQEPFDPDKIAVTTRTMTVDLLMSRLRTGALNLQPDFQRKAGIWDNVKQSRLIESLLLRIPLPSFYVSENKEEEWEVVDGVQRLTAISRFLESTPTPNSDAPLTLTGLEYLAQDFDGKRFPDLPPRLARRINETELTFHVILSDTPDVVRFNIFARLNTGGMPLTHQELRHALVPGRARLVLRNWAASTSFQRAIDGSVKPDRMADREMVLRYIAFSNLRSPEKYSYREDFGKFLLRAMQTINQMTERRLDTELSRFESAMDAAHKIFREDAFRKRYSARAYRNPINRALFESISVNLSRMNDEQRGRLVRRRVSLKRQFIALMGEPQFDAAISVSTSDPKRIRHRFSRIREFLEEIAND